MYSAEIPVFDRVVSGVKVVSVISQTQHYCSLESDQAVNTILVMA